MSEREENPKDFRIRPIITEVYDEEKKYDGKAQHYHGWEKSIKMKIKKSGNGDIITTDFYEIEKPNEEIKMIKTKVDGKGIAITHAGMERMEKKVQLWMEQAATVRKGALTVMGLIEETITTEGWIQTNHIQEDETMTERERVNSVLEYFKKKNDKYNQKGVEAEEAKLNAMGACKTRRDVEMMLAQVEIIQTTLIKIPVAFILKTVGTKVKQIKQEHKKTDKAMNTHILERLPQKAMWENLRAEVAVRDSDSTLGAYSTSELSQKITQYIDTYVMSHSDRREEEQENKEADKDPQKRRKINESGKKYEKEEKPKQVNNTTKQVAQKTKTAGGKEETWQAKIECTHFRYNNCRNGNACLFKHDKGNQATTQNDIKKAAGGKNTKYVNSTTTKRKKEEKSSSSEEDEEEQKEQEKKKKKKKRAKQQREDIIEEMRKQIKKLKQEQKQEEDNESMSDSE